MRLGELDEASAIPRLPPSCAAVAPPCWDKRASRRRSDLSSHSPPPTLTCLERALDPTGSAHLHSLGPRGSLRHPPQRPQSSLPLRRCSPSGPARPLPYGCAPRAPLSVQRLHFAPSPPSPPRRSPPPAHRTAEPTAPPPPLRVPASVGAGRARAGPGCSRPLSREPSAGCLGRQGPRVGGGMAGGRGAPAWPA